MAAAAATHATADAVARAVQHHFDDRGLSSHGTIEIEARLRGQERFAAPARDVACRLPVLTQAALARVADALARSGFVAAQKKPAVYASIVVDRAGCTDLPRCTMRVRLDDGEGGPRDGDTFEKFFRQGCTMAGMRHAWNARVFKCTFAREDDARAPVRVSAAVEAGNTSRRRFSPALERAMNELRRMKPGDFDAIDAARYTRTIRHITRRSLTDAAGVLRVDLSAVRMVPYGRQVDPASAPFAEYEVEVEWVGGLDGGGAAAAAARAVYDQATRIAGWVLEAAPGTGFPAREQAWAAGAPLRGVAGRAAREAMPKVVPIRTVDDICGVTHWTNKADGVTAYLSLAWDAGRGVPVVLTNDAARDGEHVARALPEGTYRPVGAGAGEGALYNSGSQTLLMGEYVTDPGARGDRGPVFLVFDALVVGGETLFDRAGLDDRVARARRVVDALAPGGDGARASVRLKAPVPLQGSPIAYAGNADGAVVRARGYKTDGLVLMGGGPLHRRKRTRPPVVKWKPRDEQTVDLLVHYDARRQGYFYLCADNLTATLGGRERSVYTYRPYVPPSGVRMPSAADAARCGDGSVVEFRLEGGGRLAFVRVREDKTARYIRSMRAVRAAMRTERHGHWRVSWAKHLRSEGRDGEDKALSRVPLEWLGHRQGRDRSTFSHGANNRAVADQTLRLAMGGEFDLGWLQRQQREGVLHGSYFVRAGDRAPGLDALVKMNSRAKEAVLRDAVERALAGTAARRGGAGGDGFHALDLACGEGNDLPRWQAMRRRLQDASLQLRLTGVDRDYCAVVEARRRAALQQNRGLTHRYGTGAFATLGRDLGRLPDEGAAAPGDGKYDLVSAFFAIHYAKEGEGALARVLATVADRLRPGGAFVVTYMDANAVAAALGGDGGRELAVDGHFSVRALDDAGYWMVHMHGIGREHKEPKLTGEELGAAARDAGLARAAWGALHTRGPGLEPVVVEGGGDDGDAGGRATRSLQAFAKTYRYVIYTKPASPSP